MSHVIKKPTYILVNSKFSVDVIFTSQPNIITGSGVRPSLHSNCHHQILYPKFSISIKDNTKRKKLKMHTSDFS